MGSMNLLSTLTGAGSTAEVAHLLPPRVASDSSGEKGGKKDTKDKKEKDKKEKNKKEKGQKGKGDKEKEKPKPKKAAEKRKNKNKDEEEDDEAETETYPIIDKFDDEDDDEIDSEENPGSGANKHVPKDLQGRATKKPATSKVPKKKAAKGRKREEDRLMVCNKNISLLI